MQKKNNFSYNNFVSEEKQTKPAKNISYTKRPSNFKKISNSPGIKNSQSDDFQEKQHDKLTGLKVGMKVEHKRFGKGEIISLIGSDANVKATINFQKLGKKQLLLKFAKLKIVD